MMSALSGWLKEIIVILLLATFVELVLPGKSMQRYVKVVISLFILVTILSPIIALLKTDFSLHVDRLLNELQGSAGSERQVQAIIGDGKRLQEQHDAQAFAILQQRTEQLIVEDIETKFPVDVTDIAVHIEFNEENKPQLNRIHISAQRLNPKREAKDYALNAAKERMTVKPIEPVKPVTIEFGEPSQNASEALREHKENLADGSGRMINAESKALAQDIGMWLADYWDVPEDNVEVTMTAGMTDISSSNK